MFSNNFGINRGYIRKYKIYWKAGLGYQCYHMMSKPNDSVKFDKQWEATLNNHKKYISLKNYIIIQRQCLLIPGCSKWSYHLDSCLLYGGLTVIFGFQIIISYHWIAIDIEFLMLAYFIKCSLMFCWCHFL